MKAAIFTVLDVVVHKLSVIFFSYSSERTLQVHKNVHVHSLQKVSALMQMKGDGKEQKTLIHH